MKHIFEHIIHIINNNLSFAILTYLATRLWNFVKIIRKRNWFRLGNDESRIVAYTANPLVKDPEECVDLGYILEYQAVGVFSSMIKQDFKNVEFSCFMSPKNPESIKMNDLEDNLLIIGGPFHNCVSKLLMEETEIDKHFTFKEGDASLLYGDKAWTPRDVLDSNERFFEKDYALILNIINPWNKKKRAILIMGCRSLGCLGGAEYMAQLLSHDKEINHYKKGKKLSNIEEYALVIECKGGKEFLTSAPKLMDFIDLSNLN